MLQSDCVTAVGKYFGFSPMRVKWPVVRTFITAMIAALITLSPCVWAFPDLDSPRLPGPPAIVFRYDERGPDIIFAEGFRASGSNANLMNHAMGVGMGMPWTSYEENSAGRSAFVATTALETVTLRMARGRLRPRLGDATGRHVWIYTIRATGRFFSVERSLQRAMDRMRGCPLSSTVQARLNTLDTLLNVARGEAEWVSYRHIPSRYIHHAAQYRLTEDGRGIEEVPGTRRDNPRFLPGNTHGNTTAWLIDAIPQPGLSFVYRSYNEIHAFTRSIQDRIRNASFGAQFCTGGRESPASPSRDRRSLDDATASTDTEVVSFVNTMTQRVLEEDLQDLNQPAVCTLHPFYEPPDMPSPAFRDGTCEAPEKIALTEIPNGIVWKDEQLSQAIVPWASWNLDRGRGNKVMPVFCSIDLGPEINGAVNVMCKENPFFKTFMVILRGASGSDRINTVLVGATGVGAGVWVDATQINLDGAGPVRPLDDVGHGNPARRERLIQEVFNSGDWGGSIVVAPIYTAPHGPDAIQWRRDEL